MSIFSRIGSALGLKATEGAVRPGPWQVDTGWLPASWGQYWNYWQMGYDPLPADACSIVEACVWAYIRAIAQLPGYHRSEGADGGVETITTSALSRLLRTPNSYQTSSDFLTHLIRSLLYNGNSYWIAQRNDRSEVIALHWTDPRQCRAREIRVEGQPLAAVFYEIGINPLIAPMTLVPGRLVVPARDVFHVKLATPQHPLIGVTWLTALGAPIMQQAAIHASQTKIAASMRPAGVLSTDQVMPMSAIEELKERWKTASANMADGDVPVLSNGMKFQPLTMSAEDADVIAQQKLNDQAIAAVFGVPGILVGLGGSDAQKSTEAVMSEWLAAGLGWMINHIEAAFDAFIGLNQVAAGREWTEYDTRALLRSAFRERIEGLARGVQGGIYAPNEARRLEGLPAADHGDEPRVQQQVVPLSFASAQPAPPASAVPPPAPADQPGDGTGDGTAGKELDAEPPATVLDFRRELERRAAA